MVAGQTRAHRRADRAGRGDQALPAVPARADPGGGLAAQADGGVRPGRWPAQRWPGRLANLPAWLTGSSSGRCSGASTPIGAPTSARSGWSSSTPATRSPPQTINTWSWVLFGAVCVAVAVLGLRARETPRVAQLALPGGGRVPAGQQGVLPAVRALAAARSPCSRGRDGATCSIWQAGELVYLAAVWTLPRGVARVGRRAARLRRTTWRSGSAWPHSSTWWPSWCETSCVPSTTRCARDETTNR